MNKFILIVAVLNISFVRAVDDKYIQDSEKHGRKAINSWLKEKNNSKQLPKVPAEKPLVQKPLQEIEKSKTRPMPIVLQKEEKPVIAPQEKAEIKNDGLVGAQQDVKKIEQHEQSRIEKIKAAIVNNPKRTTAAVLAALGFFWLFWNADSSGSDSSNV
ncbi:MAG TPA: hypothetical protein VHO47_02580 [Candidatus Babeliales bacterium]|nr:hypothetical protein [Candidatus Babeliales bacterium]